MLLGLHDLADGEIGQPRAAILDLLDLEAQIGQRLDDLIDRSFSAPPRSRGDPSARTG
jgi:hypothetical protein